MSTMETKTVVGDALKNGTHAAEESPRGLNPNDIEVATGQRFTRMPSPSGCEADTVYIGIMTITPEVAELFLEARPVHQRQVRSDNVKAWARAIELGDWYLSPDAIAFDEDGQAFNGQHRCLAVVRTGIPITSIVVWGLHPDTFSRTDQGLGRDWSVYLGQAYPEIKNKTIVASILRSIYCLKKFNGRGVSGYAKASPSELNALVRDYGDQAMESAAFAMKRRADGRTVGFTPTVIALAHMAVSRYDGGTEFLDNLLTGATLDIGDPRFALRRYLMNIVTSKIGSTKLGQPDQLRCIGKCFEAYRNGREMSVFKPPVGVALIMDPLGAHDYFTRSKFFDELAPDMGDDNEQK